MPRLDELANVVLRVPSILLLDLLYKCDIEGLTEHLRAKNEDMLFKYKYVIWNMYYLGHMINVVVLVLPLRHIVTLYLHILAALLLYMGHQISKDYVREELHYGFEGAVYLDSLAFNRFVSAMTSQIILCTLCAFLMKTRKVWLFSAHMLPLLARLCAAPHATLLTVNTFAMGLTGSGIAMFLLSHLFVPYRLARAVYSELLQVEVIELYRLLAVGISLWNQFAVPVLFSVFWFVLFIVQLCSDTISGNAASAANQGVLFFLLTSVSECCATPYSLVGLTFVVSYLALGLLNLCKLYLGGYTAVQNENVMHRSDVYTFTLSPVTGTLLIYSLFMVELFRSDPIESLDEVIYWVNAVSRVLEFVVALCVVAYGTWESLFGEWSWMGASVIIIHSYFNVWLRGQSGWRSFLLRQEAAKKINSLPRATAQQLQQHNDVCSICFQEMSSGVITYCRHFFHGNCLRKWLYVQETCPMCHQTVRPTPPGQSEASGDAPAGRDAGSDLAAQHGFQNPDTNAPQETHGDDANPDSVEQQEEREMSEGGACDKENTGQPVEQQREVAQGLRFSSNGDFVGFVNPLSSWSSGEPSSSHVHQGKTSPPNVHSPSEENVTDPPLPSTPHDMNENTMEEQCDPNGAGLEDGASFCLRGTQNGSGSHDGCDGTHPLCKDLDLPELNNADNESRGRLT
nr:PREDICTED: RING finger protein 145-like [Paralichthys olivaceus]